MTTTELDDDLFPEVKETIDELGKPVSFIVSVDSTGYDPATGEVGETETTYPNVKISPPGPLTRDQINGGDTGDMQFVLPAKDLAFTVTDRMEVLIDGEHWKVVKFKPLYSGTLIVGYIIFCEV